MNWLAFLLVVGVALAAVDPMFMDYFDPYNPTPDPVNCDITNSSVVCANQGRCQLEPTAPDKGHCVCVGAWFTYPRNAAQSKRSGEPIPQVVGCLYAVPSRLYAFLLEFFIGFGSGYAYIGWWGLFIGQFFTNLGCYLILIPMCCAMASKSTCLMIIFLFIQLFLTLATGVWWIICMVQIGGAYLPAGSGAPLSGWNGYSGWWII